MTGRASLVGPEATPAVLGCVSSNRVVITLKVSAIVAPTINAQVTAAAIATTSQYSSAQSLQTLTSSC